LKKKFVSEERYFSTNNLVGHLNGFFPPRGGNLNKPNFKSSNAQGEDVEASI